MKLLAKLSRRALFSISVILASGLGITSGFSQAELIITEINYHPTDANELQEFIEIKNVGDETQVMTGFTVGGVGTVVFSQTTIAPGSFLVLANNAANFNARYGFQPGGVFSGSLKNSGEEIDLVDAAMNTVFSVDYWDGGNDDPDDPDDAERPFWPESPDGDGFTLVPQNPNVNTDPNDYRNWRPSIATGGSPGADEPLPAPLLPIFINEIRTRDDAHDLASPTIGNDAIEFFNPNPGDVNIGDWFLSDNLDNPKKSPVPAGTVVPGGGYLVLENAVNGFTISLSSRGERVFLYSADAGGNLTGYVNGLHFNASGDGDTFSRHVNSDNIEQFPAAMPTLGAANAAPNVGPVVITEIMYDPGTAGGADEFIEIQNISDSTVQLFDPLIQNNNWRVEGVSFVIPGLQPTLAPGEIALITPTTPAAFRAAHNVPESIQVFGPYTGSLNNGGEEVALQRPENLNIGETSYINVDVVLYDNGSPWPEDADGLGRSLVRTTPSEYGNDPANWQPSLLPGGSPGFIFDYTGPEIVVNEILSHTDIPQVDVIELYNPTGGDVNIGNWWLSDNADDPKRFQIPAGTMIGSEEFWAVNQDNDGFENSAPPNYFGNAFQISSRGDSIYLFSADGDGNLTGYRHGFSFRATANGAPANGNLSLGRYIDSFGREHLTKQVLSFTVNRFTPNPAGAPNNPPSVGPVVISEINYSPSGAGVEFVELTNISGATVALFDTSAGGDTNNTWSFDGIDFSFPTPSPTIAADETIVILPQGTDVSAFKATFGVPAEVMVYGGAQGFQGGLRDGGEELVLLRPDNPDMVGGDIIVPQIAVDVVNFQDSDFWPAAGNGVTLEKVNLQGFSDDPANWTASTDTNGTPGTLPLTYENWSKTNFTQAELDQPGITGPGDDINMDGLPNLYAYAFGYDPHITPNDSLLPVVSIIDDGGQDYLSISFRRLLDAADLTYVAEFSTDLSTWTAADQQVGAADDNSDGTETVMFHSGTTKAAAPRQFFRVRVTKG